MKITACKRYSSLATVGLLLALVASGAVADTITFQDGREIAALGIDVYTGTENLTLISGTVAGRNYGGSNSIWAGTAAEGEERRILLRFDVSMMEGIYESIDKVTLTLTLVSQSGSNTKGIGLNAHQITSDNSGWVQGSASGAFEAGSSTWNHRVTSTAAWKGSAGLGTEGVDYVAGVIDGTKTIQAGAASSLSGTTYTWDIPLALFELWVDGDNAGLLLRVDDFASLAPKDYFRFASTTFGTESYRPQLTVEYTPVAVPEPASVVFIGLVAGAAILSRRRLS